jgi:hypothetical protein
MNLEDMPKANISVTTQAMLNVFIGERNFADDVKQFNSK